MIDFCIKPIFKRKPNMNTLILLFGLIQSSCLGTLVTQNYLKRNIVVPADNLDLLDGILTKNFNSDLKGYFECSKLCTNNAGII